MAFDLLSKRLSPKNWTIHSILGSDDPTIWTRAAIKAERLRVLGILDLVNRDVSQALADHKISEPEWQQWRQQYLGSHQFVTNMSNLWGSDVKTLRQHEQKALDWRDFVATKGGALQGPKNPGRKDDNGLTTTQLALAIGGVAAAALLVTAIRK